MPVPTNSKLNDMLAMGHLSLYAIHVANPGNVPGSATSNCFVSVDYHAVNKDPQSLFGLLPIMNRLFLYFTSLEPYLHMFLIFLYPLPLA